MTGKGESEYILSLNNELAATPPHTIIPFTFLSLAIDKVRLTKESTRASCYSLAILALNPKGILSGSNSSDGI